MGAHRLGDRNKLLKFEKVSPDEGFIEHTPVDEL